MHTEQLRSFMETSLPLILKNVFGFEDGMSNGGGWLHAVSRAGMEKEWQYVYMHTLSPSLCLSLCVCVCLLHCECVYVRKCVCA